MPVRISGISSKRDQRAMEGSSGLKDLKREVKRDSKQKSYRAVEVGSPPSVLKGIMLQLLP